MSNALFEAFYLISHAKSWSEWADDGGTVNLNGLGDVEVVHTLEDERYRDSYDYDYPQGSTAPAGMVFKVSYLAPGLGPAVRHFKMTGVSDSYGETEWNGPFTEVNIRTKTVEVFESVEDVTF